MSNQDKERSGTVPGAEGRRPIIEMQGIRKSYYVGQPGELEILHGIDLTVYAGEFVAIVGESGSGKSTLMNMIGALDRPTAGSYFLDGINVETARDQELSAIRNKKIGFVFQTFNLIGRQSALKNVELPMLYAKTPVHARTARARELLGMVGMEDRMKHQPSELSGGQKQRVAIARAMANDPALILADEPTGALDSATSRTVMDIFHQLHEKEGKTIVLITHNPALADECERVLTLPAAQDTSDTVSATLLGINDEYLQAEQVELLYGRGIANTSDADRKVCVVADRFVEQALGTSPRNVIGQTVQITVNKVPYTFYIQGVYAYEEEDTVSVTSSSSDDVVTNFYMPLETARKLAGSTGKGYQQFTVVTAADTDTASFLTTTQQFFETYYTQNDSWTVECSSLDSLVSTITGILDTVSLAISAIAAISLLVGGIGVMNIMLVSITERTREIGTRKALGAPQGAIRLQFIVEAVVICMVGGLLGIAVGTGLGALACQMLGYAAKADFATIGIAVGFSMVIGVFFGYYPANKAAKLDPIEALRYE